MMVPRLGCSHLSLRHVILHTGFSTYTIYSNVETLRDYLFPANYKLETILHMFL